jgi:hypothetical protein
MKILNLYSGVGGNRAAWNGHEVTAIELDSDGGWGGKRERINFHRRKTRRGILMATKNRKTHKIGWLNVPGYIPQTWNPIVGCSKISEGCRNCYAELMAEMLKLFSHEQKVRCAVFAARLVLPIFEKKYPYNKLLRAGLDATETWLKTPNKETLRLCDMARRAADEAMSTAYIEAEKTHESARDAVYALAYAAEAVFAAIDTTVYGAFAVVATSATAIADIAAHASAATIRAVNAAVRAAECACTVGDRTAASVAGARKANKDVWLKIAKYGLKLMDVSLSGEQNERQSRKRNRGNRGAA